MTFFKKNSSCYFLACHFLQFFYEPVILIYLFGFFGGTILNVFFSKHNRALCLREYAMKEHGKIYTDESASSKEYQDAERFMVAPSKFMVAPYIVKAVGQDRHALLNFQYIPGEEIIQLQLNDYFKSLREFIFVELENGDAIPIPENGILNIKLLDMEQNCKILLKANKSKDFLHLDVDLPTRESAQSKGISALTEKFHKAELHRLTTFDIKTLVHTKRLPRINTEWRHKKIELKTDLHTHFVAIPTAEDLIKMATKDGERPFYYPKEMLEAAFGVSNIDKLKKYSHQKNKDDLLVVMSLDKLKELKSSGLNGDTWGITNKEFLNEKYKEYIDINSLTEEDREIFENHLSIQAVKQITFDDMESYYQCRDPLVKNLEFLEPLLDIVAKRYAEAGVKQASISFSARIANPEWLAVADRVLPELEKKYGVKLRFLIAVSRLLPMEAQEDIIEQVKAVADHPAIEGIDVLASEINSTYDFYLPLSNFAKWCNENGHSDMVMRVHAGETPYHPENVGAAVRLAYENQMRVRIGHGIFGSVDDEELMKFIKENDLHELLIFEMCPDSNYALNHVDNTLEHAMKELGKAGVPIVMSSDGTGLYYTDAKQLRVHVDRLAVDSEKDAEKILKNIVATESMYCELNGKLQDKKAKKFDGYMDERVKDLMKDHPQSDKENASLRAEIREKEVAEYYKQKHKRRPPLKFTKEKQQENERRKAERLEKLHDSLRKKEITIVDPPKDHKVNFKGKIPIMITGGLLESTDPDKIAEAAAMVATMIRVCDPEKVCFVTTGNDTGIQKLVHDELLEARKAGKEFEVIGLLAEYAKPEQISSPMTEAVIGYTKWYDMHGYIAEQMEHNPNFQMYVLGGNMLTRHIIQASMNVITQGDLSKENGQLYCVKGLPGAANDKAEHLPSQFSVEGPKEAFDLFFAKMESLGAVSMSRASAVKFYQSEMKTWQEIKELQEPEKQSTYLSSFLNGDMGAVDAIDRTRYLCTLYDAHGITLDESQVFDFFKHGCKFEHPITHILFESDDSYSIIKGRLAQFGIPDFREEKKQVEQVEQVSEESLMESQKSEKRPQMLMSKMSQQSKKGVSPDSDSTDRRNSNKMKK